MVVHDDESSSAGEPAIDSPVRAAGIDLAARVAVTTDRGSRNPRSASALQRGAVEQSFDAPILGVGRPDEAFDSHRSDRTPRLRRNARSTYPRSRRPISDRSGHSPPATPDQDLAFRTNFSRQGYLPLGIEHVVRRSSFKAGYLINNH
jgi:hypothetical protein